MAPTLLGIVVVLTAGHAWSGPVLPVASMESLVTRAVNDDAAALSAARGFRGGRPLVVRVLDRPHLRAEHDAALRAARSPGAADAESRLQALLGLGGQEPATGGAPARGADVTGFYDPVSKRVYVGNWVSFVDGRAARLKDIAEVLLDRRFPVTERPRRGHELPRDADGEGDTLWARMALLEGDATVQTLERLSPGGGMPPTPALADELDGVRQTMVAEEQGSPGLDLARRLFVALDGTAFVASVRARAPWSVVNQLWEHPPVSTEQVLHPEKYLRHEAPDDVAARLPKRPPGATGPDDVVYSDTLGELGVRAFLQRAVGDYKAQRAATGWGGDRVRLQRGPPAGEAAAVEYVTWVTTWDEASDAQDFAEQAGQTLALLAGGRLTEVTPRRRAPPGPRDARRWRTADARGRIFALEWQGRAVTLLLGAPSSAERSLPALTAAATRRGRPTSR